MKLRAITLTNVRRFVAETRIDGIGDGLNVLCQPNEFGKSTLFDALQAMFFKPYGSKDRAVKALQPHAGGAPEVTVELETAEGAFTLHKRWLSKPEARVMHKGRLIAQADAAEDWIARTLGGSDGGPSGLLWVRQGMTGLTSGAKKEDDLALEARRDLMSSVSHEVEAMTGGRRMDAALARCRAELGALATSTGRPKSNGRWKDAQDRVETLLAQQIELQATARDLHEALDIRRRLRRDLAEIEAPEAVQARADRLAEATAAHETATRHAERIEKAQRKLDTARLSLSQAQSRLETLRAVLREEAEAGSALAEARKAEEAMRKAHEDAEEAEERARRALEQATADAQAAETARRVADRQIKAREGVARRAELAERIARAEAARAAMEAARAGAALGPDPAALRKLDTLVAARSAARTSRDATAARMTVHYAEGRTQGLTLDGAPLSDGQSVAVVQRLLLDIGGIGSLDIRPGDAPGGAEALQRAESDLARALKVLDCADPAEARTRADARAAAQRDLLEATAIFNSLAPDGLDPLRAALVAIPVAEAGDDASAPDPDAAEKLVERTAAARLAAQGFRDAAAERLSETRSQAARAEAALSGAQDRVDRAAIRQEDLGTADESTLEADFHRARAALEADEAVLRDLSRAAPDLAAAEAALTRAKSVDRAARDSLDRLRPDLARLDERISRAAGDAVEERLAETNETLARAEADLARIVHEVAVLRRLEQALEAAKSEARDRYFAPISAELRPLLALLWPEAELIWAEDTLLPTALVRDGAEEPIDILSGGTQEQVALLVRLAFARMLARAGRHAPVILDDALVFTDDDRIERMFDALHRQAGDLQIIVLSCRQRAFRDLGGRTLRVTC